MSPSTEQSISAFRESEDNFLLNKLFDLAVRLVTKSSTYTKKTYEIYMDWQTLAATNTLRTFTNYVSLTRARVACL